MRSRCVGFVSGCLVLAAVAGAASAKGRDKKPTVYTVAGGAVTLPEAGISKRDAESKSVAFGPQPRQVIQYDTAAWRLDDVYVTLTVVTLPPGLNEAPTAVLLKGAKKGLLEPAGQGATLEDEATKWVMLPAGRGECMGLFIRAGKQGVRARIAVHAGRLYQLTAVGSVSDLAAPEVAAALDSFAVTGPPTP